LFGDGMIMKMMGARSQNGIGLLAGIALAAMPMVSTDALAQVAAPVQVGNCTVAGAGALNPLGVAQLGISPGAASSALAGAIGNVNTAFLAQQGSAFVSAPANPVPDQPGGGVWGRAIGGDATLKSTSTSNGNGVVNGGSVSAPNINCNNHVHENFAGVQVGADIARLNWNGWNVHLGTTAGYLGANSMDNNGFSNTYEVPFFGTYVVATHGRFFADLMVREEFYNVKLDNQNLNYFNQPVGAHGFSISTSAGYNADLGNGWFVEPSGGFIYSRTSVDNFVNPGTATLPVPGLISTNDVESEIGRLSIRAGKTIETSNIIWQPFASASVFHEFAGNVTSNYSSLPNGLFLGGNPLTYTQSTSTSRVGTYGQYSLGIAAQVINTGWLGFVRVDYRSGDNIYGVTGNAGLRYQFTPEMIASVMPTKALKAPRAYIGPTNWTGFYLGGFAGAAAGRSDIQFVGAPFPLAGNKPWVFGGLGGIELGYNYQFANNWVLGVEGDIGAANVNGGRTAGTADGLDATGASVAFSPAFFTVQDRTNWMATVTGRVGYSWGRTLFYAKGGVAIEDSTTSVGCIYGPTGQVLGTNGLPRSCLNQAGLVTGGFNTPNDTRVGWTLGYGTEFDLGHNWSAKAEYDYLSFGRHTALASDGTTFLTNRNDMSQVKVGVNYRFSGPGAVVAKY
jgi:opacity protein-like surface antigen